MTFNPSHPLRVTALVRQIIGAGVKITTPPIKGGTISLAGANGQLVVTRKG